MWDTQKSTAVGAAYSAYVPTFVKSFPQSLDYVEVPFELLQHDPSILGVVGQTPLVLHCASLSIASPSICADATLTRVRDWVEKTSTPWVGEHLAFISADRTEAGEFAEPYAPGEQYNIGYTVSPPMNEASADRVIKHLRHYTGRVPVPLIIENSPLYFSIPTSTMSQAEYISTILSHASAGLLLDLAHLAISAKTTGVDAEAELERFPLEKVVEIHISGIDTQADGDWDNHASRAPELIFRLLRQAMCRANPRAVTLEYNWSSRFPTAVLLEEIDRVRAICAS
jgi:uncharacterized protein